MAHLSEVSTLTAGAGDGNSQYLSKHFFFSSSHYPAALSVPLQSFPLFKVWDLNAQSPTP